MAGITIYTDSTSTIDLKWLEEHNVKSIRLTYIIDDKEYVDDGTEESAAVFYQMLRSGKMPKTSAISVQTFMEAFEKELQAGNDVVYTGLSGKLSSACNNAFLAMEQLNSKYSDNQVYVTDSICTAGLLALLIYQAVELRDAGKTPQEIIDHIDSIKHHLFAFVSVTDLMHLKRGGRISGAAAVAGSILNIRPIIIFAADGSLALKDKLKGNKKVFKYFLSALKKYALDVVNQDLYIIQSDYMSVAEEFKEAIKKEFGSKNVHIIPISPIIGTHLGPEALIIAFQANCTRSEIV